MNYTLKKTESTTYQLRHKDGNGMYWADITLSEYDKAGRIQVASDFGDWQYYWGACGKPFKEFLLEIGKDYVAGKWGADRHFNLAKTIQVLKEWIEEDTKCGYISSGKSAALLNEIALIEEEGPITEMQLHLFADDNCPALLECDAGLIEVTYDYTPQFNRFWSMVWTDFTSILKTEIKTDQP